MNDPRPRRSTLVVPGSSERFIAKAASSSADQVLLDLEDSVTPDALPAARQRIIAALPRYDRRRMLRAVRVNATSSPWFYGDVITIVEAAGALLDVIVLPKVNVPGDVYMLDRLLAQIEAVHGYDRQIAIEAQIETAQGMINVEQIATSSPRLAALIFGPGDFAASIGAPTLSIGGVDESYPGHVWHAALSRIVWAAATAGLAAIDGPYAAYNDVDGLNRSAGLARALGCDGKWAIHPSQIAPINAAFSPTPDEIVRAQRIVASLKQATTGAATLGGEMIDGASIRLAERVLARAQAAGLLDPPPPA
jgi:citrate lyase subunit beta / citryl-CoA lyase